MTIHSGSLFSFMCFVELPLLEIAFWACCSSVINSGNSWNKALGAKSDSSLFCFLSWRAGAGLPDLSAVVGVSTLNLDLSASMAFGSPATSCA